MEDWSLSLGRQLDYNKNNSKLETDIPNSLIVG